ncbi:MAG: hypothetical protein Q4D57_03215 [Clostridia bacterium]|nr:hypothetical protein [Clostridia bacterium]
MGFFKKIIPYFCMASFLVLALSPICSAATNKEHNTMKANILVVGKPGSGKTTLIKRLCNRNEEWYRKDGYIDVAELKNCKPKVYDDLGAIPPVAKTLSGRPYFEFTKIAPGGTSTDCKITFIEATFDDPNLKDLVRASSVVFLVADATDPATYIEGDFIEKEFQRIESFDKKDSFYLRLVITKADQGREDAFTRFQVSHLRWGDLTCKLTEHSREGAASAISGLGISTLIDVICNLSTLFSHSNDEVQSPKLEGIFCAATGALAIAAVTTVTIVACKLKHK